MDIFTNPLSSPALSTALLKTGAVMAVGLAIMSLTQITRLRQMAGSTAFKKFCSWIVILPLLLTVIYSGRAPFAVLLLFILWKSSCELTRLFHLTPYYSRLFLFHQVVTGVIMVFVPTYSEALPLFYLVSTLGAAVYRNQIYDAVKQAALVVTGNLWVGYCLTLLARLHLNDNGEGMTTLLLGMVIVSDVFAYLFGSIARKTGIGKQALTHNISPNKTMAGAVGNIVGAAVSYAVFGTKLGFPVWLGALLVVLSGIGATIGDLAESIVKRNAGVKDASKLIPFHGGMLDRVDSLLVVTPIGYGIAVLNEALVGRF